MAKVVTVDLAELEAKLMALWLDSESADALSFVLGTDPSPDSQLIYSLLQSESTPKSGKVETASAMLTATLTHKEAQEEWDLVPISLVREAADFYLMLRLTQTGVSEHLRLQQLFYQKRLFLVKQFQAYTDMATGGELRHARNLLDSSVQPQHQQLKFLLKQTSAFHGSRLQAWQEWRVIKERYGITATSWAASAFHELKWGGGSYGGHKWGVISDTLRNFERGEINDVVFLDTCFSLQHNGGIYFNKCWRVDGLQLILDAVFKGEYMKLYPYASDEVRALWDLLSASTSTEQPSNLQRSGD